MEWMQRYFCEPDIYRGFRSIHDQLVFYAETQIIFGTVYDILVWILINSDGIFIIIIIDCRDTALGHPGNGFVDHSSIPDSWAHVPSPLKLASFTNMHSWARDRKEGQISKSFDPNICKCFLNKINKNKFKLLGLNPPWRSEFILIPNMHVCRASMFQRTENTGSMGTVLNGNTQE